MCKNRLAKNKKAPARFKAEDRYILTTKLFCGECGAYMAGESGTSRTGVVHHYYKCSHAKRKLNRCRKKNVKKKWIEDIVISKTMDMLGSDAHLQIIVDILMETQKKGDTAMPYMKKPLAKTQKAIDNMLDAIQDGIYMSSTKERLETLEKTKEYLSLSFLQEELQKPFLTPEKILFWLHRYRGLDTGILENRERLIDTFINAKYLFDDRIVFTYNGQEGDETISLDQIKSSGLCSGPVPKLEKVSC